VYILGDDMPLIYTNRKCGIVIKQKEKKSISFPVFCIASINSPARQTQTSNQTHTSISF